MFSKFNYFFTLFLLIGCSLEAQVVRNEGKMNISGGYLVVNGSYQSEGQAGMILDGIITVSGNWTNNSAANVIENPDTNGEVIFNGTGTQTIGGSANLFDFEKLTVNSSSSTLVEAGKGVSAYGACSFSNPLVLKTTTTKFRSIMATFINHSNVSGNITMELSYSSTGTSASGSGRGLYFSSPISNATSTIFNVTHGTNLLWYQDEVNRVYNKVTTNGTALTIAKGYILRSPIDTVVNFTGTPNTASSYTNNNILRAVTGQYYLFGNPYPSVIDWETISTKTNLINTVWYQTSSTAGTPMVVDTWNGDTQVGTANNGTAPVDGKIPPMQSFWVQCNSVGDIGTLTVSSSNRTHNWGSSQFLKSPKQVEKKDILRLRLQSVSFSDEAIIVQSESAQDGFGSDDSRKMLIKDASRAELYTLSPDKNNKNLAIQSVKPITSEKSFKIGVSVGTAGEYKLLVDLTGQNNAQNIFLEDKQLSLTQDLQLNPEYKFSSDIVDDTSRFIIHIYTSPEMKVTNSITACSSDMVDLTDKYITLGSETGLTYTYWTDAKAKNIYLTPTNAETGTYYIKGTSKNGSYSIAGPINVTINPSPKVFITNPSEVIEHSTLDLTNPEITLGSSEGLSYSYWLDSKATIPFDTPQYAAQGNYYIKGTFLNTGCYTIVGPVKVKENSNTKDILDNEFDNSSIFAFNKQIHLVNFEINSSVAIFDIVGRQHYYESIKSNNEIITTNFKTGIYIVRVIGGKGAYSKKVYIK